MVDPPKGAFVTDIPGLPRRLLKFFTGLYAVEVPERDRAAQRVAFKYKKMIEKQKKAVRESIINRDLRTFDANMLGVHKLIEDMEEELPE